MRADPDTLPNYDWVLTRQASPASSRPEQLIIDC